MIHTKERPEGLISLVTDSEIEPDNLLFDFCAKWLREISDILGYTPEAQFKFQYSAEKDRLALYIYLPREQRELLPPGIFGHLSDMVVLGEFAEH